MDEETRMSATAQSTSNHCKWSAEPALTNRPFFFALCLTNAEIGRIFIEITKVTEAYFIRSSITHKTASQNSNRISCKLCNKKENPPGHFCHLIALSFMFSSFLLFNISNSGKFNQCHNKTPATRTPNISGLPRFWLSIRNDLIVLFTTKRRKVEITIQHEQNSHQKNLFLAYDFHLYLCAQNFCPPFFCSNFFSHNFISSFMPFVDCFEIF